MEIFIRVVQFILTVIFTYIIVANLNLDLPFFTHWSVVAVVVYLVLAYTADKIIQKISHVSSYPFFTKGRIVTIIVVAVAGPVLIFTTSTMLLLFLLPVLTSGQL